MKKLKLSPNQEQKLTQAINAENAYKQQLQLSQQHFRNASEHRQCIFEMVLENHNVDLKSLATEGQIQIQNGHLILPENSASERIKKEVSKPAKLKVTK